MQANTIWQRLMRRQARLVLKQCSPDQARVPRPEPRVILLHLELPPRRLCAGQLPDELQKYRQGCSLSLQQSSSNMHALTMVNMAVMPGILTLCSNALYCQVCHSQIACGSCLYAAARWLKQGINLPV